jgi:hypothetical protein
MTQFSWLGDATAIPLFRKKAPVYPARNPWKNSKEFVHPENRD